MRRTHRAAHRRAWPILALLVGAGLLLALVLRPAPEQPPGQPIVAREMTR
jgi:hypothetical protein